MPHMRGDEPIEFSRKQLQYFVCPTCVGMNRHPQYKGEDHESMPHMRGDEPIFPSLVLTAVDVCPTCVGMNRAETIRSASCLRMPHMRGDEPDNQQTTIYLYNRMPHMRGDEPLTGSASAGRINVCPTCVGMNRNWKPFEY